MSVSSRIQRLFAPRENWPLRIVAQFKRQRQIQALWIGIIAFSLPALLYYGNRTSPGCFRDSISHSYYIPFWGDVFVALTFSVGLFLLFYRGQSPLERCLSLLGGLCAILVALFPTDGSGCDAKFDGSRIIFASHTDLAVTSAFPIGTDAGTVHLIAAVLLFVILAIFNLFIFTATDTSNEFQMREDNRNKRIRNGIYKFCGGAMLLTIIILAIGLGAGFKNCEGFSAETGITNYVHANCTSSSLIDADFWDKYNLTFVFEWIGLALFGIAWIVKGRAGGILLRDDKPHQILSVPRWLSPLK